MALNYRTLRNYLALFALALAGCGHKEDSAATASSPPPTNPTAPTSPSTPMAAPPATVGAKPLPKARVSSRPANEKGKVFVVEYHQVRVGKGDMVRLPKDFKADLERLYKLGFRPCTVSEYLNNKMDLPPGASPAVFTFDDSAPSQLQLLPDGSVDPKCAVGIWQEFAKDHPDFPVHATFYVLPDEMWGQAKMRAKKIELILGLGSELGNHTVTHTALRKLSDENVKKEIAEATDDLEKMGGKPPFSLALPYGISPKNRKLLSGFTYKGKEYAPSATFLVGAGPAPAPTDPKLDRTRIPRIQSYNGELSLSTWLDDVEAGKVNLYVAP